MAGFIGAFRRYVEPAIAAVKVTVAVHAFPSLAERAVVGSARADWATSRAEHHTALKRYDAAFRIVQTVDPLIFYMCPIRAGLFFKNVRPNSLTFEIPYGDTRDSASVSRSTRRVQCTFPGSARRPYSAALRAARSFPEFKYNHASRDKSSADAWSR